MQVQGHHIGGSKGVLGQVGPEEFIDDAIADEPDLPFLFLLRWNWMGGDNDPYERAVLGEPLIWTIVEHPADPALGAVEVLIGRQVLPVMTGLFRIIAVLSEDVYRIVLLPNSIADVR